MKKNIFFLSFFVVILFSGCFLFTDFTQSISLAENALKIGSGTSALNYSNEALRAAQNDNEKSKANMLKGYAYYLLGQYSSSSDSFNTSLVLSATQEGYSGKILSLFMMGEENLLLNYIDEVDSIPENWYIEINGVNINKERLYNAIALSAKLEKNQVKYNEVQNKIDSELAAKMEAFFNE